MPLILPDGFVVPTRDEEVARYLRSHKIRAPEIDTTTNTQPWIDAQVDADTKVLLHGNLVKATGAIDLENASGETLLARARSAGITDGLRPAVGATGFVNITTVVGGSTILAGDVLKDTTRGLRFKCTLSNLYTTATPVPIVGLDTGPATNLAAGTTLRWESIRPGCFPSCTVDEQTDGSGLSGGRNAETESELRDRIRDRQENPPASGNDAAYQDYVSRVAGITIQKPFSFPAILGPGTIGICFTMPPARAGASRVPNAAQLALVAAGLIPGDLPADDSVFVCALVTEEVNVRLRVQWAAGAPSWADITPWPAYSASDAPVVSVSTSATVFTLTSTDSGFLDPQVGQTIAFFDDAASVFRPKRILTVSAGPPWAITCTLDSSTDQSYTPAVNDLCCPWSDSLDSLVEPVARHFDTLGPGEQVATFFDAGYRQRRQPANPETWPSDLTSRVLANLFSLTTLGDVQIASPTLPYVCPTGTPAVSSYILELGQLLAFPI